MTVILIKNGTVVNEDYRQKADVLIKDGLIVEVGSGISAPADAQVLDATDRLVIPGGIDPHTHMQLPFMGEVAVDDFYSGTKAALSGGTTMIIDFVIPTKDSTPVAAYKQWRGWADPKVCCDYGLSMAITKWNEQIAEEMKLIVSPEYGINSFKFFLALSGVFMVGDDEFYQGMLQCAKLGALARVHAENGSAIAEKCKHLLAEGITGPEGHTQSRPEELEAEATNRACVLAAQANCPLYVVHVISKGAARAIAYSRSKGNVVFGELIAAGLATDGSHYFNMDWLNEEGRQKEVKNQGEEEGRLSGGAECMGLLITRVINPRKPAIPECFYKKDFKGKWRSHCPQTKSKSSAYTREKKHRNSNGKVIYETVRCDGCGKNYFFKVSKLYLD